MAKKSSLKIQRDQLRTALSPRIMTKVDASLTFVASDVKAAVAWADQHTYNYNDLGDLLLQWSLDGAPGGDGPNIDESTYDFYGM